MHTVRNRLASRPSVGVSVAPGPKPPKHAASRHEPALIQRGAKAVPLLIPDESGLIEARPKKRRNAKGKKARKAAARLAEAREGRALPATPAAPDAPRKAKSQAKAKAVQPEQLPAIPPAPLLQQRLAAQPALVFALPNLPEPLVEPAPVRVLSLSAMPELLEPPALSAGAATEPPAGLVEPESEPVPALADAPLPRARALVPARRLGLVDVIAFLLRDSGRRLARWSARRHKSREEQAALRRAKAQQINLQRELEALDALRRAKCQSVGG